MMGAAGPGSEAKIEASGGAFGKYQLFASLGRGGMADVFLSVARGQMGFNKLAVIKRLRPALAEEAAFRNMFLDEARLAARLSHPNIVHTYEVGEQKGVYFIAMEYLEGQPLNKVFKEALRRREGVDVNVVVRVIADALAGLSYAHELRDYDGRPLRVIHRDISPHNIFVTYDGHTKLVDFGIAKAALSSSETEVGILKGKVAYMAPEQAMGLQIDGRADLFAMGIVLWELLAQRRLMTGESAANTLHKLMNDRIPRLSEVVPHIDPELDSIVARALEKDKDARWSSASEMRDALEAWLGRQLHQARHEDVGRQMMAFFGPFREETQRQIQKYMAVVSSAQNTQELQALTAESLKRMEQSGANVTQQLLRLGTQGNGSGSGVVPYYGGLGSSASAFPSIPSTMAPPAAPRSNTLLIVGLVLATFAIAVLLGVVFALRERPPVATAPSAPPATTTIASPSEPSGSVAPEPPSTVPVVPASALANTPSASPVATTAKPSHPGHVTSPVRSAVKPSPPPPPPEEPGFVTMSAYPWAKVTEGARVVCAVTPCNKVQMTPGTHTLTFENGESPGQKQTVTVQVKSGETAIKTVGFK